MTNAEIIKRIKRKDEIVSKKILAYGRKHIKDKDNVMALELSIIASQELSQIIRTLEKQK